MGGVAGWQRGQEVVWASPFVRPRQRLPVSALATSLFWPQQLACHFGRFGRSPLSPLQDSPYDRKASPFADGRTDQDMWFPS